MRQRLLTIMLVLKMGIMIMHDFFKYSIMEQKIKDLFHMSDYSTCMERATAIVLKSTERALKFYACAIAHHRESKNHNEDRSEEIKVLEEDLTSKESVSASRGWWLR